MKRQTRSDSASSVLSLENLERCRKFFASPGYERRWKKYHRELFALIKKTMKEREGRR